VRIHLLHLLALEPTAKVGNDGTRAVVGSARRPTGTDAITSIDKDHGDNGHVVLGFNGQTIVVEIVQKSIVIWVEDGTGNLLQLGKDVTGGRGILTTHAASTKLTGGSEKIDVVGPDEGLAHTNNGTLEGDLAMMVGRVLRNITSELSYLDLSLELTLEAGEEDLSLRRLEAVHNVRNASGVICVREQD